MPECVGCDKEAYKYQLCSSCQRVICFKETCSKEGKCVDTESCSKAIRTVSKPKPRCDGCGGELMTAEGHTMCPKCGAGIAVRP